MKSKETIGQLSIYVDTRISLWQAIKLRIAGKAYLPIAEAIAKKIVEAVGEDGTQPEGTP